MNKDIIYALIDPRNGAIRYIGVTNNPKNRMRQHAQSKYKTHRANWWNACVSECGKAPTMQILTSIGDLDWATMELFFIASAKWLGCRLTNSTDGGKGTRNPTEKDRNRRREQMKKFVFTPEIRQKMADAKRGRKLPEETKRKMSAAHSTPEARARVSQTISKAWNDPAWRERYNAKRSTPEYLAKVAEIQARPEVNAKRSASLKATLAKPEVKAKKKAIWDNPAFRTAYNATISTPEYKAKISKALTEAWNRPGERERRAALWRASYAKNKTEAACQPKEE